MHIPIFTTSVRNDIWLPVDITLWLFHSQEIFITTWFFYPKLILFSQAHCIHSFSILDSFFCQFLCPHLVYGYFGHFTTLVFHYLNENYCHLIWFFTSIQTHLELSKSNFNINKYGNLNSVAKSYNIRLKKYFLFLSTFSNQTRAELQKLIRWILSIFKMM